MQPLLPSLTACAALLSLAAALPRLSPVHTLRWAPPRPAVTRPRCRRTVATATGAVGDFGDWWDSVGGATAAGSSPGGGPGGRWIQLRGCDVLLPESGEDCVALAHFVGGAFVGSAPQPSYCAFLERLAAFGVAVVATPTSLLSGLDHFAAAAEVSARWEAVLPELRPLLEDHLERNPTPAEFESNAADVLPLPVFGLAHSLGAKLLLLLGSQEGELAGERVANVLIAFNNYPASRSVPLLEQAVSLGASVQRDGSAVAAAVLGGLSSLAGDFASRVSRPAAAPSLDDVRDALGGVLGGAGASLSQLSEYAQRFAAETPAAEAASEFRPGPEETEEIVRRGYRVRRNLLLRFEEDDIDQSEELRKVLRRRLAEDESGVGGRTELRSTPGTHITPNLPELRGLDWTALDLMGMQPTDAAGARDLAERLSFQQEAAAALAAAYIRHEVKRTARASSYR